MFHFGPTCFAKLNACFKRSGRCYHQNRFSQLVFLLWKLVSCALDHGLMHIVPHLTHIFSTIIPSNQLMEHHAFYFIRLLFLFIFFFTTLPSSLVYVFVLPSIFSLPSHELQFNLITIFASFSICFVHNLGKCSSIISSIRTFN